MMNKKGFIGLVFIIILTIVIAIFIWWLLAVGWGKFTNLEFIQSFIEFFKSIANFFKWIKGVD